MAQSATPATYDLHLHTFWSYDATAEPEAYFRRARELGLRCIAITEHHNIDSAGEVGEVAERYPEVRLIVAAELTVKTSVGAVDLLCYNLPRHPAGALAEVLDEYHQWQRDAGASRSRGMQAIGYDYDEAARLELLRTYRPERALARQGATHTLAAVEAAYFLKRGFVSSMEEYGMLRQRIPREFARPPYPAVERVVPAVKAAGGLVVIAHPSAYFLGNDLSRMDALRQECGLDGIECAHRSIHPELTPFYREYCRKHGMVSTAGSDCHNPEEIANPPQEWGYTRSRRFASHLGEPEWLDEFLERQ